MHPALIPSGLVQCLEAWSCQGLYWQQKWRGSMQWRPDRNPWIRKLHKLGLHMQRTNKWSIISTNNEPIESGKSLLYDSDHLRMSFIIPRDNINSYISFSAIQTCIFSISFAKYLWLYSHTCCKSLFICFLGCWEFCMCLCGIYNDLNQCVGGDGVKHIRPSYLAVEYTGPVNILLLHYS